MEKSSDKTNTYLHFGKMKMMFQTLVENGLELGTILEKRFAMKRLLKSKVSFPGTVQM